MDEHAQEREKEKPIKIFVQLEDVSFDPFDLKRVEKTETYNHEQPEYLDYNVVLRFNSFPFELCIAFSNSELRERKVKELLEKLEINRIKFV